MAAEIRLEDGTLGFVWTLLPEDRAALAQGYQELSLESRYHRFLSGVPRLSEKMLKRLVDGVDGIDHVALVLFLFDAHWVGSPAGVARMIRYADDPVTADVAVTIAEPFRGRGAASALLEVLLEERPKGVTRVETSVAADNPASLAMLRHLGRMTVEQVSSSVLDVVVELADAEASALRGSPTLEE